MIGPEPLGEQLVHQVVRRVLHHLDLFEDDLLFLLDVGRIEGGVRDQIGEDVDGDRQVLVEHLHVVARVLLGGERVELAADRVHFLGDAFGGPPVGALEQHVLDEVRDAGVSLGLVAGSAREPDPDADRPHVRHALGDEPHTVSQDVAADARVGHV
jgi:hypothetical protein